ncbi:N-acetylglucosamine-6-phosphate deacetylase [Acididesulfobacillus acetoxydans]|uniref:N-acetylglucosamine-6-phosphate deacetylase n=1 Tax=Acididesulfobacillus acetoxydans TaxID=1561005 RepID=A0A8S0WX56_9FIRM|nr:N-acetylglucosamine-6-phosphate deacetylase [Acididesulfobacillus acetoxydans]CAA7600751.1 N-acetylglucosamine-6-phosphate deacetylase [Acididesulfobacillus acetoxydans]CEJ07991.1 N-acetylglucosamine-6-phosphate deacetylase [Acididesulfobacillus acetoxydans]
MNDLYVANGRVLIDGAFQRADIVVSNGKISRIAEADSFVGTDRMLDAAGKMVLPGFIDIHTHGGAGVDVNNATIEDLEKLGCFFASQGTTSWLASIVTDTEENTLRCINCAIEAAEQGTTGVLGIHLEGPFLSRPYKGAMSGGLLRKADARLLGKYLQAARGYLKYLTVSPEVEGVPELIQGIRGQGIVVALGHSGADYETTMKCIQNGAESATHTFNAMRLPHQHDPGIGGAVLETDVFCEAICDGRHLHPGMIRLLLKTKGFDRVIAVTDSMMAAGMPDGRYKLGANEIEVQGGDAKLVLDGTRAGSTLTAGAALKNLVSFTGKKVEEIIPLFTANPAALLRLSHSKGSISSGMDADLVLVDEALDVVAVIIAGMLKYHREGIPLYC